MDGVFPRSRDGLLLGPLARGFAFFRSAAGSERRLQTEGLHRSLSPRLASVGLATFDAATDLFQFGFGLHARHDTPPAARNRQGPRCQPTASRYEPVLAPPQVRRRGLASTVVKMR